MKVMYMGIFTKTKEEIDKELTPKVMKQMTEALKNYIDVYAP